MALRPEEVDLLMIRRENEKNTQQHADFMWKKSIERHWTLIFPAALIGGMLFRIFTAAK